MAYISQNETNNPNNSYCIDIWTSVNNVLTDVSELSFQIFDISSGSKKTEFTTGNRNNVQIYPIVAGTRQTVDVTALVPTGNKISTGHYYAPWTCTMTEPTGDHAVVWYFKRTPTSNERSFTEEFVVLQYNDIIGGGGGPCLVTYHDVRTYMRDHVYKNILLDEVEHTDHDICHAISMTVDRFNIMTPMSNYLCANFPNKYLLLIGTAAHLMLSVSFEQLRNQLSYNDGNIHVGITDKHQLYRAAGEAGWAKFEEIAQKVKFQMNLESCYGDLQSPYSFSWRY